MGLRMTARESCCVYQSRNNHFMSHSYPAQLQFKGPAPHSRYRNLDTYTPSPCSQPTPRSPNDMGSRTPTCRSISQPLLHERTSTAGTHSFSHLPTPRLIQLSMTCTSPAPLLLIYTGSFSSSIPRLEQAVILMTLLRLRKHIDEFDTSKQPVALGLAHRAFTMSVISKYTIATSFVFLSKSDLNERPAQIASPECHGTNHPSFSIIFERSKEACQYGFDHS